MANGPGGQSRNPAIFAILLGLGIVGVLFRPSSTTVPRPSSEAKATEAKAEEARKAKKTPPDYDPLTPLKEYRGLRGKLQAKSPFEGNEGLLDESLEFLIVTVPDPIDSRFGYRFDTLIDSVQMALEAREYLLDRFWLPWMPGGQQPKAHDPIGPILVPGDPVPLHEKEPGVMLFRPAKGPEAGRLKVVFLVGETPLSGGP